MASSKFCPACSRVRPLTAFNRHLSSTNVWCRECANSKNREWKRSNPDNIFSAKVLERGVNADPIVFSLLTCRHVDTYVRRAIARFEHHTGHEAPPYLQAITQLTAALISEHPPPARQAPRSRPPCDICGEPKKNRYGTKCTACKDKTKCPDCEAPMHKDSKRCWRCQGMKRNPGRKRLTSVRTARHTPA